MQDKEKLTRKQLHVLPFLITNPNVELASKNSGISPKQIFSWLNQPLFRQELENKKNEAIGLAVDRLKFSTTKATETLIGLLDTSQSDSLKHRISIDLLNMTLKFMEYEDFEKRLRKLEETIK